MITKLLFNINNIFYYLFLIILLCITVYLIYKLYILENEIYFLNEKVFNLEIGNNSNSCTLKKPIKLSNVEEFNMNDIIMNQIFEDNKEPEIINVENVPIIKEEVIIEPIFDLKKDTVIDDKESIISTNNLTKKKLQKLNLEKLKEKCVELELNTEGTKIQLIERILEKELN